MSPAFTGSAPERDGTRPPGPVARDGLRVLVVHNRYQQPGGEDAAVARDLAALERAGHAVEPVIFDNDVIAGPIGQVRAAWEAPHAPEAIRRVLAAAERFRPDVVHVHNTFPLVSPGVHAALRARGIATVQTLHNYRLVCANGFLMRNGRPCESCLDGTAFHAVLHACYRGSRVGSFAVARLIEHHRRAGTWTRDVDRFVALTPFARGLFARAGLPAERIRVRPNGLDDPGAPSPRERAGMLFVGRLSAEKGVATLGEAARMSRARVTVIGDGPDADALGRAPSLVLLGRQPPAAVRAAMERASALVLPSVWFEGLPMVLAEAFAAGCPAIVSRLGSLAGLVEDGVTGLHVAPGDPGDLARAMDRLTDRPEEAARMGRAARAAFETTWSEAVTTPALVDIYAEAIASRRGQQEHAA